MPRETPKGKKIKGGKNLQTSAEDMAEEMDKEETAEGEFISHSRVMFNKKSDDHEGKFLW